METKQWTFIDKSDWGPGEWQSEPDKMQWTDEATGLPCLIRRAGAGALCGYVGVPESHPYFEKDFDNLKVDVHGGLTFCDFCHPEEGDDAICHVPGPGEPERVWWFGFDCGHAFDLMPSLDAKLRSISGEERFAGMGGAYRNFAYVQEQCTELARQIKELE